ncbi:histidine kinase [Fibrella aestuarina BUZ 2]|uniref:histidine kinase n=1 Tax=Fibrella aestuarina BUZ 2 TaxID=1166018 RepID=I0K6M3_9BACT|nr:HAMP domain-containing sensor histidine kinase [Fibrella aestuarina]CCG99776.1 histidine kinase [Fibrella aestuarina BUZ 2]
MKNVATYAQRNWYYGLAIVVAFLLLDRFGPATFRLGWLVWSPIALAITILGYFVWINAHNHNVPYIHKEVLDTIVHEFQTPISAIKMAADILATPFGKSSPERMDKYVHIIQEETERLQLQVDVMLSLARADRNRLTLTLDTIDIHTLIQSISERHGPYLKISLQAAQHVLMADRLHLTNVLHNLLDNAIKYSPGEPELTIHTESDATGLMVSVIDRGVGIPKNLQQKIFKPFFRVGEHHQLSVKGFGLGLSYVQRIIEAHNWRLELTSEVGEGSEFKIRFPQNALVSAKTMSNV